MPEKSTVQVLRKGVFKKKKKKRLMAEGRDWYFDDNETRAEREMQKAWDLDRGN